MVGGVQVVGATPQVDPVAGLRFRNRGLDTPQRICLCSRAGPGRGDIEEIAGWIGVGIGATACAT